MAAMTARVAIDWAVPPHMVPGVEEHDLVPAGLRHRRFRAIALFQFTGIPWPATAIMILAIANGLLTSIALGTFILVRQMDLGAAFRTAIGMSFVSMVSMEAMMNVLDPTLTGAAVLTWWVVPIMLAAGG